MGDDESSGVLARTVRVLRCVAEAESADVARITRGTGLPVSTTYRLVSMLLEQGLLRRLDDGKLAVGWVVYYLANVASRADTLVVRAQPYLAELSKTVGETAFLGVRSGDEFVIVGISEASEELRTTFPLGTHLPLGRGALGKVLVEAEKRRGCDGDVEWAGYAISDEDAVPGVRGVAAPVYGHTGAVVCGVSVAGPVHRFEIGPKTIPPVMEAARRLSRALGYQEQEPVAVAADIREMTRGK